MKGACRKVQVWGGLFCMLLGVVLVLSALNGCAAKKTSGMEGAAAVMEGPDGDLATSNFVIVNNPELARGIQIVDLRSAFVGDLLQASVTLVSKYSKTVKAQYKFAWFDKAGMEIQPDGEPWQALVMHGNESKTIQGVAPDNRAREFKIKIRPM